ncbi:FMN-dependent dehydrogenase family protein [Burkholderia thailandensis 34]|nr:FMN-dependent dehydrogenase family protein [Burkholderia thailandensis 34]
MRSRRIREPARHAAARAASGRLRPSPHDARPPAPGFLGIAKSRARARRRHFGNIVGHVKGVTDMSSLDSWTREQFDPTIGWRDVEWVQLLWGGKPIVKGVLDPDDAIRAVDAGADALVVSNHGGRQLDGAMSSVEALPAVVDAAGRRAEVWLDGGVRTGQDVLKAVARGAPHWSRPPRAPRSSARMRPPPAIARAADPRSPPRESAPPRRP